MPAELAKTGEKIEGGLRMRGVTKQKNISSRPLISIIIATFNAEKDLEQCILSVLKQKYKQIEFIVVDGGSADRTLEIIKKYDDRIDYWISEKDNGPYEAFNKGIDAAQGEWVYFLGADDTLYNETVLDRMFSSRPSCDIIYGNVLFDKTGEIYAGPFTRRKLCRKNLCQQAVFYRRDLFEKLGKFELEYPLLADWVFNIRVFSNEALRKIYRDEIVAIYSLSGISSRKLDWTFARRQADLIKEMFGFPHFVYFTIFYILDQLKIVFGLKKL